MFVLARVRCSSLTTERVCPDAELRRMKEHGTDINSVRHTGRHMMQDAVNPSMHKHSVLPLDGASPPPPQTQATPLHQLQLVHRLMTNKEQAVVL